MFNYRKYLSEVHSLRKDCRYQNIKIGQAHKMFKDIPSFAWTTNKSFLRYSIENQDLTELRIDLDEKELEDNINLMLAIEDKAKLEGMNISWYYSGGRGIHGHLLIDIGNIQNLLKYSNLNIDASQYDEEFKEISKLKREGAKIDLNKYPLKQMIQFRSDERALIKKAIIKYLGFENKLDAMLFSSQEMFTYEGTKHRKTEHFKIHLNIRKLKEASEIMKYISENKFTPYLIDYEIFSKVYTLDYNLIKFIVDYFEINKKKVSKRAKKKHNPLVTPLEPISETKDKELNDYIIAFSNLFNIHHIDSKNVYAFMVIKTIYKLSNDYDKTLKHFTKFVELTDYNLTCTIHSKVYAGIEEYRKNPYILLHYKHYFTYREFMRELKRIERENK